MLKTLTGLRDYLSNSVEAIFFFNLKKYSPETVIPFFFKGCYHKQEKNVLFGLLVKAFS